MSKPIKLPCLRGRIGDWIYYTSLLNFKELANRTSMVPDIHKNKELSRWIQREVSNRSEDIVHYLKDQPQRFFNSIICGIYGGTPKWQELDIESQVDNLTENEKIYFGKTFGILNLSGNEKIFAIDGQHRTKAIKLYTEQYNNLNEEEVSVIFVAHKDSLEGEIRTRRLFSTLNRYALPVTISEIIALDEEDNCAIITRILMEEDEYFADKIKYSNSRALSSKDKSHFTNIILLYDIITILLTSKPIFSTIKVGGHDIKSFTSRRIDELLISKELLKVKKQMLEVINAIPSLSNFFKVGEIDREDFSSSLIFRPIGQKIIFYAYKVAKEHKRRQKFLKFLSVDNFNLNNPIWNKIFIDQEGGNLKTDIPRQTLAIQLILMKIGISITMTPKEKLFMKNFNIQPSSV
jgi:DNA sulfur modification protein DndB